ncbi:MAG: hypothetical protein PVG03_13610 [Desulfarculaceae bacterium]|jgi:hypothetical protein
MPAWIRNTFVGSLIVGLMCAVLLFLHFSGWVSAATSPQAAPVAALDYNFRPGSSLTP